MPDKNAIVSIRGRFVLFALLFALGVAAVIFLYGESQRHLSEEEAGCAFAVTLGLKERQIVDWRHHHIADAEVIRDCPMITDQIDNYLKQPASKGPRARLMAWMSAKCKHQGYGSAVLFDAQGRARLAVGDQTGTPGAPAKLVVQEAIRTRQVVLSDIHRGEFFSALHFDLVIPIFAPGKKGTEFIGVLMLRINPQHGFFPIIRSWPTLSRTAEVLLVRNQGERLGEGDGKSLCAAGAVAAETEWRRFFKAVSNLSNGHVYDGLDERGVRVIATSRRLTGFPWTLVVRMEAGEAFELYHERMGWAALTGGGILTFLVMIFVLRVVRRRAKVYRKLYEAEAERSKLLESLRVSQEQLKVSEERYRLLVEQANDAIFVADAETGLLVDGNRKAQELVGRSLEEIRRMHQSDLHPPEEREHHSEIFRKHLGDGFGASCEITLQHREGRCIPSEISVSVIDVGGRKLVQSIFHDLTERRRLEEQLRHAQKMEAIGRLAGGIAHDFNNILMVMRGYASMLAKEFLEGSAGAVHLAKLQSAAERAAALTRQLLVFSHRQLTLPCALDLNQIMRDFRTALEHLVDGNIEIVWRLDPKPCLIRADPSQMEQVLMNLAVNARDAMPRGGRITLTTSHTDIPPGQRAGPEEIPPGSYVALVVSDNGCGMTSEVQSHLFEPFFTTKTPDKGTGLGLSTVYGIVHQSGGRILVRSHPGDGSIFTVLMPLIKEAPPVEKKPSGAEKPRGGHETILVAEDDETVCALLREVLKSDGYTVIGTGSGEEALRVAQENKGPIQLLLSDIIMPGMNGIELVKRMEEIRPETRVLLISGYHGDETVQQFIRSKGVEFLHKPIDLKLLLRKIREILDAPPPPKRPSSGHAV